MLKFRTIDGIAGEAAHRGIMKSLSLIVLVLGISFYYTDIEAANGFQSLFLPLVDFVLLCAAALWLAGRTGWKTTSRSDSGGFFDFFDGGGGCD